MTGMARGPFVFEMTESERPKVDRAVRSFLKSEALHPADFTIRGDGEAQSGVGEKGGGVGGGRFCRKTLLLPVAGDTREPGAVSRTCGSLAVGDYRNCRRAFFTKSYICRQNLAAFVFDLMDPQRSKADRPVLRL